MIFQYGGASYSVSLEPLPDGTVRAMIGARAVVVTVEALDGGWRLTLDGQSIRVYAAARASERFVAVQGEVYTLTVPDQRRRAARGGGGDLSAQMPGQVREVFVQAGEAVTRGQSLLLLEAMKMETRVSAPADGRVTRVLVRAGDVVDRGQRLIEME